MRIRLKGINSIAKTLADATRRTYWYAWKGGPPLRGEPGTPEFVASYNEAVARKMVPPDGKLISVLQKYQASGKFDGVPAQISTGLRKAGDLRAPMDRRGVERPAVRGAV
jgi:hypothetical protein